MFTAEYNIAKKIAQNAGKMIRDNFISDAGILKNEGKDIKTNADFASHELILEGLRVTGIPIISEEDNNTVFNLNDFQWIIDPLDGTLNLSRGFDMSAIAISLWDNGKPILGITYCLFTNQLYSSFDRKGAYRSNDKISVSNVKYKNEAILATGFPSGRSYSKESLDEFIVNVQKYKKIRMLGSAALMLAYVSSGVFDVYFEEDIYIWDVAAGLSLISEAGGSYILKPGNNLFQYNVTASNKSLIEVL